MSYTKAFEPAKYAFVLGRIISLERWCKQYGNIFAISKVGKKTFCIIVERTGMMLTCINTCAASNAFGCIYADAGNSVLCYGYIRAVATAGTYAFITSYTFVICVYELSYSIQITLQIMYKYIQ